jgi:hypothetical protein
MAGTWTSERLPQFEAALQRLTDEHRELKDEPLHLAIVYHPKRDEQDIFLFEVIGGPMADVNIDRDLYEVTFDSTPGFKMPVDKKLHLVLTNAKEMKIALQEGWSLAEEIVKAVYAKDYRVLHEDETGTRVLKLIKAKGRADAKAANHG